MLPNDIQENDLLLISEASKALNKYLDAVGKNETFENKKARWVMLKEALSSIGRISPDLKENFIRTHNLSQYKSLI